MATPPIPPAAAQAAADAAGHRDRAAAAAEVLDRDSLDRLRELDPEGRNQLLQRVVLAFGASTARLLPQLEQAAAAGDLNAARMVAHTLKSSSASLGALRLSQQCAELERQVRADQVDGLPAQVASIGAEIGVVLQALKTITDAPQ